MEAKRELVISLHFQNKRNSEICRELKTIGVNRKFVQRTINRFKETGSVKIKKKTGSKKSTRSTKIIKAVRERIRRNPSQTQRKLAFDLGVSKSSIQRIIKSDLHMRAFKKKRIHGLTQKQKEARVKKCRYLIQWHADTEFLFSDEKLFVLQEHYNAQNDRVYAVSMDNIPIEKKNCRTVSKCIIGHGLGCRFKKWQTTATFHRKGGKNKPAILFGKCFEAAFDSLC